MNINHYADLHSDLSIIKLMVWRYYCIIVLFFLIISQGAVKIFVSKSLLLSSIFLCSLFFIEMILILQSCRFKLDPKFYLLFVLIPFYVIYFVLNYSHTSLIALFYYLRPIILFFIVYRYLKFISNDKLYCLLSLLKVFFTFLTIIGFMEVLFPVFHKYLYFISNLPVDRFPVVRPVSLYNSIFDYGFGALFLLTLEISLPCKKKCFSIFIFSIALFGILVSFTRTIWLAGIIVSIYLFFKGSNKFKLLYSVTLFAFGYILFKISDGLFLTYLNSFIVLSDPTGSIDARFVRYANALVAIKANPLGYGLGYGGIGSFLAGENHSIFAENGILTLVIDLGFIGMSIWFLFFGQFWNFTGVPRLCIILFLFTIFFAQNYLTSFVSSLFIVIYLCFDFNKIKFYSHQKSYSSF